MPVDCQKLVILDTRFGFLGLIFKASTVLHLSLGHRTRRQLKQAIWTVGPFHNDFEIFEETALQNRKIKELVGRLLRYTEGEVEQFCDVPLDLDRQTPFARRVMNVCRKIPYGKTISYATLAKRAGSPRGARSAGTVMAKNRFPLLVPCHRVVAAGSRLGGFSAPGGLMLKRQLLSLEASTRGEPLAVR